MLCLLPPHLIRHLIRLLLAAMAVDTGLPGGPAYPGSLHSSWPVMSDPHLDEILLHYRRRGAAGHFRNLPCLYLSVRCVYLKPVPSGPLTWPRYGSAKIISFCHLPFPFPLVRKTKRVDFFSSTSARSGPDTRHIRVQHTVNTRSRARPERGRLGRGSVRCNFNLPTESPFTACFQLRCPAKWEMERTRDGSNGRDGQTPNPPMTNAERLEERNEMEEEGRVGGERVWDGGNRED